MPMTNAGTFPPEAVIAAINEMKMTNQGTKPAMHPMVYDVQFVFEVVWL